MLSSVMTPIENDAEVAAGPVQLCKLAAATQLVDDFLNHCYVIVIMFDCLVEVTCVQAGVKLPITLPRIC